MVDMRRGNEATIEQVPCFDNRGVLIPIVPGIFSEFIATCVSQGTYEGDEASILDALIEPGDVVLEIGAGCGFISTLCAKNPLTEAVYCVEANPNLIDVIKLTHRINKVNVTVYEEILAKEAGETDFFLHKDFWASGTHSSLGTPVKVKTTSFQSRLNALRPTVLVVDIEGGEESLFEAVDLSGVRKIMLELHQHIIGRTGMKKVFDLLSAQHFHYDAMHSTFCVVTFSHTDIA